MASKYLNNPTPQASPTEIGRHVARRHFEGSLIIRGEVMRWSLEQVMDDLRVELLEEARKRYAMGQLDFWRGGRRTVWNEVFSVFFSRALQLARANKDPRVFALEIKLVTLREEGFEIILEGEENAEGRDEEGL